MHRPRGQQIHGAPPRMVPVIWQLSCRLTQPERSVASFIMAAWHPSPVPNVPSPDGMLIESNFGKAFGVDLTGGRWAYAWLRLPPPAHDLRDPFQLYGDNQLSGGEQPIRMLVGPLERTGNPEDDVYELSYDDL